MTVTEAQTWAALGVLATFAFGALGLFSSLIVRVIRSEVGRLESTMESRFDAIDVRFNGMDRRIDSLDRDVQALVKHTFGLDRG